MLLKLCILNNYWHIIYQNIKLYLCHTLVINAHYNHPMFGHKNHLHTWKILLGKKQLWDSLQVIICIHQLGIRMVKNQDIKCLKPHSLQIVNICSRLHIVFIRRDMRSQLGNLILINYKYHHYINSPCIQFLYNLWLS